MARFFASRAPATSGALVCLFNGDNGSTGARIGAASRTTTGAWTEYGIVITIGSSGAWDDVMVRAPWLVNDGSQLVCYFDAYDGTNFRIGRATAGAVTGPWTKDAGNPVMDLGSGGSFDSAIVAFPTVLYEPTDTGKEWKMWYEGGTSALGSGNVGYAYSSDGIAWTKVGQVLSKGSGGAWDDEGVSPAAIVRATLNLQTPGGDNLVTPDDDALIVPQYTLFYQGRQGTTVPRWQGGIATFSDPEGAYTKSASNPILLARFNDSPLPSTQLSATGNIGDTTLSVGDGMVDASAFRAGEPVVIGDGNSETETHRITSIPTSSSVVISTPLVDTMASGGSGTFRSFFFNSVIPRSIVRLNDGTWEMWGSAFQPLDGLSLGGNSLREGTFRATATALDGPWTFDLTVGLAFPLYPDHTGWHKFSAENPSVISAP